MVRGDAYQLKYGGSWPGCFIELNLYHKTPTTGWSIVKQTTGSCTNTHPVAVPVAKSSGQYRMDLLVVYNMGVVFGASAPIQNV